MRKILAAIDCSAAATPVLAIAAAIAELYDATLEVLHMGDDQQDAARSLARAAGAELRVLRGAAVSDLIVAADSDDDVLAMVVGARGLPLGRRPVGSTARALITQMRKPLVIVPPEARTGSIDRVLVPLDGTHASAAALESTIELARDRNVEVVVLHCHYGGSIPRFSDQAQYETEAWSGEFMARYCPHPQDVELKLRAGAPGESVLDVAQKTDAKLIALSWSQVLTSDRGAVVREVLARSTIPVLLIREGT